jgi:hypothetical protein
MPPKILAKPAVTTAVSVRLNVAKGSKRTNQIVGFGRS